MPRFIYDLENFLVALHIFLQELDGFGYIVMAFAVFGVVAMLLGFILVFHSIVKNVLSLIVVVALIFCISFWLNEQWIPLGISAFIACFFGMAVIRFDRILPALSKKAKEKYLTETNNDAKKPKQRKEKPEKSKEEPKEKKAGTWQEIKATWRQAMEEAKQKKERERKKGPWERSKEKPKQNKDD